MEKIQVGRDGFLSALNAQLKRDFPGLAPFRNVGDSGYDWPAGTSVHDAGKYQAVASKVHETREYDPSHDKHGLRIEAHIPNTELEEARQHLREGRFDPSEFIFERKELGVKVTRTSGQRSHYETHAHFWVNEFGMELRSGVFGSS